MKRYSERRFGKVSTSKPSKEQVLKFAETGGLSLVSEESQKFCPSHDVKNLKWFEKAKLAWEASNDEEICKIEPEHIDGYVTYL
ncbi:hypothetical protein RCC89_13330 [Cytophagaceae bacterium ABcell3]|nr:hypothetical protein RCC89_13330 [Cytophagaceae bacterium ABcell3]